MPESELRKRLEATRHHPEDRDDFGILAAAGDDLPGAVVVRPAPIDAMSADAATATTSGSPWLLFVWHQHPMLVFSNLEPAGEPLSPGSALVKHKLADVSSGQMEKVLTETPGAMAPMTSSACST